MTDAPRDTSKLSVVVHVDDQPHLETPITEAEFMRPALVRKGAPVTGGEPVVLVAVLHSPDARVNRRVERAVDRLRRGIEPRWWERWLAAISELGHRA